MGMVHRHATTLLVVLLALAPFFSVADLPGAEPSRSSHWAFQPIRRSPLPDLPPGTRPEEVSHPVDRFIVERLARLSLAPLPSADRLTLLRRVHLDLIGMPPEPHDVAEFAIDVSPDALDRHVDRLLASPRYGERWARPWLDLAHYADTDGYLTDQARPVAWRYRQWLVEALNRDQPFAEFTLEQLAGELLPDATLEQRLATGFLRNTLSNREGGADLEEFRVEQIVDRVQMVGTIWLGLTIGCCRCHDHKFDPFTQREFFQLYALIDGGDEVNVDAPLPEERDTYVARRADYERRRDELVAPYAAGLAELQSRWERRLLQAADQPGQDHVWDRQWEVLGLVWGGQLGEGQLEGTQIVRTPNSRRRRDESDRLTDYFLRHGAVIDTARFAELKLGELAGKLEKLAGDFPRATRAPAMRQSPVPRPVHLHERGDFRSLGEPIGGGVPAALPPLTLDQDAPTPLDRLTLARWLVRDDHPLPARVFVNRAWQELFGRGLVATADDFGTQGDPPSHPELLDWLAVRFRELDGSMKALHRELLGSAAYRRTSTASRELLRRDPSNRWLARQSPLRMSADQIRDAMLRAAGLLDERVGGPSVFPAQPASVVTEAFDNAWKPSRGGDRYRRGLYTYLQRLSPFAQQVTFDAPSLSRSCSRRERSNTPLQALALLNDSASLDAAAGVAWRVLVETPLDSPDAAKDESLDARRVTKLVELVLNRASRPAETNRLVELLVEQRLLLAADDSALARLVDTSADVPLDADSETKPKEGAPSTNTEPDAGRARLAKLTTIPARERAAWLLTASVALNLHEFITRR